MRSTIDTRRHSCPHIMHHPHWVGARQEPSSRIYSCNNPVCVPQETQLQVSSSCLALGRDSRGCAECYLGGQQLPATFFFWMSITTSIYCHHLQLLIGRQASCELTLLRLLFICKQSETPIVSASRIYSYEVQGKAVS